MQVISEPWLPTDLWNLIIPYVVRGYRFVLRHVCRWFAWRLSRRVELPQGWIPCRLLRLSLCIQSWDNRDLPLLDWMHSAGYKMSSIYLNGFVVGRSPNEIIIWLREHGARWTGHEVENAAAHGNATLVRYMIKAMCPWTPGTAIHLAKINGHLELASELSNKYGAQKLAKEREEAYADTR